MISVGSLSYSSKPLEVKEPILEDLGTETEVGQLVRDSEAALNNGYCRNARWLEREEKCKVQKKGFTSVTVCLGCAPDREQCPPIVVRSCKACRRSDCMSDDRDAQHVICLVLRRINSMVRLQL